MEVEMEVSKKITKTITSVLIAALFFVGSGHAARTKQTSKKSTGGKAPRRSSRRSDKAGLQFPVGRDLSIKRSNVVTAKNLPKHLKVMAIKALQEAAEAMVRDVKAGIEHRSKLSNAVAEFVAGVAVGGKITQKDAESFFLVLETMAGNPQDPDVKVGGLKSVTQQIVNEMERVGGAQLKEGRYRGRKMQTLYKQISQLNNQLKDVSDDASLTKKTITREDARKTVATVAANPQEASKILSDEKLEDSDADEDVANQIIAGAQGRATATATQETCFRRFVKFTLRHKYKIAGALALSAVVAVGGYYFVIAKTAAPVAKVLSGVTSGITSNTTTIPSFLGPYNPLLPSVGSGTATYVAPTAPATVPTLCEAVKDACGLVVYKAPTAVPTVAGYVAPVVKPAFTASACYAAGDACGLVPVKPLALPAPTDGICEAVEMCKASEVMELDDTFDMGGEGIDDAVPSNWASRAASRVNAAADEITYCSTWRAEGWAEKAAKKVNCWARSLGTLMGSR